LWDIGVGFLHGIPQCRGFWNSFAGVVAVKFQGIPLLDFPYWISLIGLFPEFCYHDTTLLKVVIVSKIFAISGLALAVSREGGFVFSDTV